MAFYGRPAFEKYEVTPRRRSDSLCCVNDEVRNHGVTMIGEFVGTFLFLFFALASVQIANSKPDRLAQVGDEGELSLLQILYISFGFGTSLAVNVWLFFRISGGMFNPAVSESLT
jgi:aquaporin related protein